MGRTASSLSPTTPPLARGQETAVGRRNTSPHISGQSLWGPEEFCCGQSERDAFCAIQLDSPSAAPPWVRQLSLWCHLYRVWGHHLRCPARPAGSFAQSDSAMRFSSPGDLPSSAAFSRLRWQSETHLSCTRRLLSYWQRMQSGRPSSREEAVVLQPLLNFTQERWWPPANPGSASLKSGPVKLPFKMLM